MSGYLPEPEYVPSPWLENISDPMAELLTQTLHALAIACEDRYAHQLRRYWKLRRSTLYDPQRPWLRQPVESEDQSSHAAQEQRIADFNARQLDLFQPQPAWENDF